METQQTNPLLIEPIPRLLLTAREAATALGISPRLLWSHTRSGAIPCIRIGTAVRYSPEALAAWIEKAQTKDGSHGKKS